MNYECVLFDLDGTLLDTLNDIGSSVNRTLANNGFATHPMDSYRLFVGDGVRKLIERSLPPKAREPETVECCLQEYRSDYSVNWKATTRPYEGVPELLDGLLDRGLKIAVLSNKPDDSTQQCVNELLGNWDFDEVIGADDNLPRKPDPAGAFEIARLLDISPDRFLYVGDTGVDMQTATAAGMYAVGVLWGFRDREELERNGARTLISRPLELMELLK